MRPGSSSLASVISLMVKGSLVFNNKIYLKKYNRRVLLFIGSYSSPRLLVSNWSTIEKTKATTILTFPFSPRSYPSLQRIRTLQWRMWSGGGGRHYCHPEQLEHWSWSHKERSRGRDGSPGWPKKIKCNFCEKKLAAISLNRIKEVEHEDTTVTQNNQDIIARRSIFFQIEIDVYSGLKNYLRVRGGGDSSNKISVQENDNKQHAVRIPCPWLKCHAPWINICKIKYPLQKVSSLGLPWILFWFFKSPWKITTICAPLNVMLQNKNSIHSKKCYFLSP